MNEKERERELRILKMKLARLLCEIQWLMPDEEFYETFSETLGFVGEYF